MTKEEKEKDFVWFLKQMQKSGTVVMGADMCPCAKCVARRKGGDIRPIKILNDFKGEEEE